MFRIAFIRPGDMVIYYATIFFGTQQLFLVPAFQGAFWQLIIKEAS
jgi:hypothetical protein